MTYPDSKVYGANMGPIWGRQDPDGTHVGPMNFAIWVYQLESRNTQLLTSGCFKVLRFWCKSISYWKIVWRRGMFGSEYIEWVYTLVVHIQLRAFLMLCICIHDVT